jgi:ADP-ribose diphosphatase
MSVDRTQKMQETLVDSVEVSRGKLLVLRHDTVIGHDGGRHLREVVAHRGGVAIVPLTSDHKVVLIRQYRHAVGEVLLEIPAGTLDRLDNGDIEDPDVASRRELGEEIGQAAGRWLKFGVFYTTPGFTTEAMHLYLARDLTPIEGYEGPEPDENLVIEEVPVDAALRLAESGQIRDGKTLAGLFWLGRWLAENEV